MVHPQGKFMLKKADFSFEKIQEKRKKYRNGQKNFSVFHEKNLKNIRIVRKDMPENPMTETKKADFSFKKVPRKQKNYGNRQKNFSPCTEKRQEKLFRRSEKGLKKRMIRMKKQQIIFCKRTEKMQKRMRGWTEKSAVASEKI